MTIEEDFKSMHFLQINKILPNPMDMYYESDKTTIITYSCDDFLMSVSKLILPENYIYIRGIYVVPNKRKQGIASIAIKKLIEHAKKSNVNYLSLEAEKETDLFWNKLGFYKTGEATTKNYHIYILNLK